jgi:hypothetical protein
MTGCRSMAGGGRERGDDPGGPSGGRGCGADDEGAEGVCAGGRLAVWRFAHPARIAVTKTDAMISDNNPARVGENRKGRFD